jgi:hypothetical protein
MRSPSPGRQAAPPAPRRSTFRRHPALAQHALSAARTRRRGALPRRRAARGPAARCRAPRQPALRTQPRLAVQQRRAPLAYAASALSAARAAQGGGVNNRRAPCLPTPGAPTRWAAIPPRAAAGRARWSGGAGRPPGAPDAPWSKRLTRGPAPRLSRPAARSALRPPRCAGGPLPGRAFSRATSASMRGRSPRWRRRQRGRVPPGPRPQAKPPPPGPRSTLPLCPYPAFHFPPPHTAAMLLAKRLPTARPASASRRAAVSRRPVVVKALFGGNKEVCPRGPSHAVPRRTAGGSGNLGPAVARAPAAPPPAAPGARRGAADAPPGGQAFMRARRRRAAAAAHARPLARAAPVPGAPSMRPPAPSPTPAPRLPRAPPRAAAATPLTWASSWRA